MATKTNKKDWSLVIWLFGWLLNFVTVLKKLATKLGVPFEAFERLGSEAGEETLIRVLQLILDDYNASLPKPPAMQGGAHLSRTPGKKVFYFHDAAGRDWESEERIAWGLAQRNKVAPNGYRPATEEETCEFAEVPPSS